MTTNELSKLVDAMSPTRTLMAQLDRVLKPYDEIEKALKPLFDTQAQIQKSLSTFMRSQSAAQDAASKYLSSFTFAREETLKQLISSNAAQEAADKYFRSFNVAQEEARKFTAIQDQLAASSFKWLEQMDFARSMQAEHDRQMEAIRNSFRLPDILQSEWMTHWNSLAEEHSELVEDAAAAADEVLDVPPLLVALAEAEDGVGAPQEVRVAKRRSLEEQWLELPWHVRVGVRFFLTWIVQPIFAWYLIQSVLNAPDTSTREQLVIQINQVASPSVMDTLRCVSADTLRVRSEPSTEGDIVARLRAGQAVEVMEVRGHFALVRYVDLDTREPNEGWAAVRYLPRVCL